MSDLVMRLREPFHPDQVGWKPQAVKDNRALAVAYIDARNVMDRLDEVVGAENWEDEYQPAANGCVICHLKVFLGERETGRWVSRCDVGGPSDQPDAGDKMKAAFSDALKRAAIHFGIGRYLYGLPAVWESIDQYKRFTKTPTLPAWAKPWIDPIIEADSLDRLAAVWKEATKDGGLELLHVRDLVELKERRKAELNKSDVPVKAESWEDRLAADPNLEQLNAMAVESGFKGRAWALIVGYATKAGLTFDREQREFYRGT